MRLLVLSRAAFALILGLLSPALAHAESIAGLGTWVSAPAPQRESVEKVLGSRTILPGLVEILQTGSSEEKRLACHLLETYDDSRAEDALVVATHDADARVQAQAIFSLRRHGGGAGRTAALDVLGAATSGPLLKAALAALGELGTAADRAAIGAFLTSDDPTVRVNAAAALAMLGDSTGESVLLAATESNSPQARREATYALGWLDSDAAVARLHAIADNPSARWRTAADIALVVGQLRHLAEGQTADSVLKPLAQSPNDELARWARDRILAKDIASEEKHVSEVHGGGVDGDPTRSLSANAFAVLGGSDYSAAAQTLVEKGTVDEDKGGRPINHFYNPITGLNTMPLNIETALRRAERRWNTAALLWRFGPRWRNGAYHMLGRSMHLLQDMTSPAHIHDDPHIPPLDPDDFENWGQTKYPIPSAIVPGLTPYVPVGTVTLPNGRVVQADSPLGFVQSMAMFTYELTSYEGEIVAAAGAQPDSELARMFPDGRLYYQDAGVLGCDYWQIDDVGSYGLFGHNAWWPNEGDSTSDDSGPGGTQHVTGLFYIENVGGDHDDLKPAVFERPLNHLTDTTGLRFLEIYAGELYPECVRYCAAYLQTFQSKAIATGLRRNR